MLLLRSEAVPAFCIKKLIYIYIYIYIEVFPSDEEQTHRLNPTLEDQEIYKTVILRVDV